MNKRNVHFIADNFHIYISTADMLSHTTDVSDTVKMTRKDLPSAIKPRKLKKGE
jgi:hypothetical protein